MKYVDLVVGTQRTFNKHELLYFSLWFKTFIILKIYWFCLCLLRENETSETGFIYQFCVIVKVQEV